MYLQQVIWRIYDHHRSRFLGYGAVVPVFLYLLLSLQNCAAVTINYAERCHLPRTALPCSLDSSVIELKNRQELALCYSFTLMKCGNCYLASPLTHKNRCRCSTLAYSDFSGFHMNTLTPVLSPSCHQSTPRHTGSSIGRPVQIVLVSQALADC